MTRRLGHRVLTIALALALASSAARADGEGGGARSIFSAGAGNRALAMGSAYAAVADDASGLLWNVGGLGRVTRLELQATQASDPTLDVSEAWIGLAAPNWRWGTVGMSYRHVGTTGIERRDDRNLLVEDGLGYAESELMIGYGRALGDGLALGGALKARHQELAGYGAGGFGMDLGVVAQPAVLLGRREGWAQGIRWGIALANVIEPSIKLDRESVADPHALRTGMAWRFALGPFRSAIASADLEQAPGQGSVVHAGMELTVQPAVAVRAGLCDGALTAGTGMRWRDWALDYTYEQEALGDVHHVGVSWTFGATVAESREAAARSEEQAIQSRLAAAFQKRQADQLSTLLADAEARRSEKRWDEALDLIATVHTLEPADARAAGLEQRVLKEKALVLEQAGNFVDATALYARAHALAPADSEAAIGERRCQEESDLHAARSADLRRRFAAAMEDFTAERLQEARNGFKAVLAAEPRDADAQDMLRRTEASIERRVQALGEQADRYLKNNLWNEAAGVAAQIAALDPSAAWLGTLGPAITRARQESAESARRIDATRTAVRPRVAVASERAPVSRQKLKELELLYKRGLDAMGRRRSDDAIRYWELVWSADPAYPGVGEALKREYLTRGMESYASGRLDEASGFWEKALDVDPKDARAIGYLQRAQKQLARTREILGAER